MSEAQERQEEKRINLDDIRKRMSDSEKQWSETIRQIAKKLEGMGVSSFKDIPSLQAEAISSRQLIFDEISIYVAKIYKEKQQLKKLEKVRFEFYASSYPIKTSGQEKLKLINSDLADRQYLVDLYDTHVEHLRETASNLKDIGYGIKNKLAAYGAIGSYDE